MKAGRLGVIMLVLLFSACGAAQDEWPTSHYAVGNFSISAPGVLEETGSTITTPLGPIRIHTFRLEREASIYELVYTDYPVPHLAEANEIGALEGEMGRALEAVGAKLLIQRDIWHGGALGIEFRGDFRDENPNSTRVVYGRVYLFETRLYRLTVITDRETAKTDRAERFLKSFQIVLPPAPRS